jgi:hypothetical protein
MERLNIELQTSRPDPALRGFVRYYSQRYLAPGEYLDEPVTARLGGLLEFHFASLYKIPIIGTDRFESCAPMLVVGPITYRRVQLRADGAVEALTVMFQPFGLRQLFAVPTHLLTEHAVEGHSLLHSGLETSDANSLKQAAQIAYGPAKTPTCCEEVDWSEKQLSVLRLGEARRLYA